ncbi:hypothetical protein TNCV_2192971 [Trichonephila clavipes]|nr:hypothetical protein TNCV_2192971 [Trichonephila clavipes]
MNSTEISQYANLLRYIQGNKAFTVQKNGNTVHIKLDITNLGVKHHNVAPAAITIRCQRCVRDAEYHQPQYLPHHVDSGFVCALAMRPRVLPIRLLYWFVNLGNGITCCYIPSRRFLWHGPFFYLHRFNLFPLQIACVGRLETPFITDFHCLHF